nr:cupredoxin domain-containing protein [Chloroflexota bacterium]
MRLKRLSLVLLFGALPIVGIASSAVHAQGQEVPVVLTEWSITPPAITVQAGQPVRLVATNSSAQRPHDLHIEGQGVMIEVVPGDGNIAAGQMANFEFTFATPGSYLMWCPVGNHRSQGMEGTFVVTAAAAGAPAAQPSPKPA